MKKITALLLSMIMVLSLAACGAPKTGSTGDTTKAAGTKDKVKVGFLIPTMQAEFFIGLADGLSATFGEMGYDLTTVSFDGDAAKAVSAIENMVISKVDVIIAMISDSSCDSALKEAQDKGIKIFECGVETEVYDLCLVADNTDAGNKIGEMAADFINNDLGGSAKVAVFTTEQNVDMSRRGNGIVEKLEELAPNAQIVEIVDIGKDIVGSGTTTAETLLQKYPDLNVICAYGDMSALEAAEAVNAAGKGGDNFGIFACDATAEGLKKIANGDIFRGTIYMGDLVASMAEYTKRLAEGETFGDAFGFENIKVTANNVSEYITE